ncbi:hypothetical protein BLNAU_13643 [Blattamonas nauphoetae]|uniref:Uncharacterized protein n=1 Tax=Blattamonas nauphoetae TaxID=2049346 RepID=A0ABQ9XG94_9EUKA|nr:hypothetical protein BLNAU_13643 [Blattamonas nauphoetae]
MVLKHIENKSGDRLYKGRSDTFPYSVVDSAFLLQLEEKRLAVSRSITSDKLFAVTGGSLQVTSCSFSPKGEYPFSFQLICGSAHQVTLESTNVSSASLSSVALISTSCSVSMSNCRFSSIVVLEGHGSVLRADASNTARVSVLNTVLSGCSSSGVGSAILLSKLNGGSFSSTDWDGMFNLSSTMGEVLVFDASLRASKSNSSSLLYEFHPHVAGNPIECRLDSGTTRIVDWRNSPVRHWLMRCRPLLLWLRCVVQNGLINP